MKVQTKKVLFASFIAVLAFGTLSLTSCKKNKEKEIKKIELAKVSQETISYDGQTLAWGQVNNASQYEVSYDGLVQTVNDPKLDVTVEKDVSFNVRAVAAETNQYYTSCPEFTTKSFTYKGTIEPTLDPATRLYSWDAVEGARGYKIKENGSIYQGYQQETSYKLVGTADTDGNNYETFQVKADFEDKSCFTVWSKENKVTILSAPKNVTYDGRLVKWDKVNKASNYVVRIYSVDDEGKETVMKEETLSSNDYVFNVFGDSDGNKDASTVVSGSYSISITSSNGNKDGILDSNEQRFAFSYVDPIAEIAMSNGTLSWEVVPNADYYVLEVNGEELDEKVLSNKYSDFDHSRYASFTVRVTPRKYDSSLYSPWSSRFTFTCVESPYVVWNSDGQAYSLDWSFKADGTPYNYQNTTFDIIIKEYGTGNQIDQFTVTDNASYSGEELLGKIGSTRGVVCMVQVKANKAGEGQNDSDSFLSDPIYFYNLNDPSAYTITTKEVFTDDLETTLYFNDLQIKKEFQDYGFEVQYRAGVNSTGGNYNSDDAVKKDTVRAIMIPANSSNTGYAVDISYKCESKDNKKMLVNEDGEKAVFILSDTVNTIHCERLASPTTHLVGSLIDWEAINMASSYQILVKDLNGRQVGDVNFVTGTSFNIATLGLEGGKYDVSVSALGNGNIIFSSLYSNPIRINQLPAPQNIRVEGVGDSRKICWDSVDDCSSYQLTIGTHYVTVNDANEYGITQSLLSTSGNTVSVVATGNADNNTLTSQSSEVIVLYKLKTPTNIKISDTTVSFDGVDAFGGRTVGYEIWIGDEKISGDEPLTTTHFDLYNYNRIKESYDNFNLDIQVRAVLANDETQFFASELSNIANITRLASPKNVKLNQYTGAITWDAAGVDLNTITGYEVLIKYNNHPNLTETYVTSVTTLTPKFNENCVGDKVTITVRALGNGVDYVSSNPYNVSTAGENNMIGCSALVEKLPVISLDNNPITYTVDEDNHIIVVIDEKKLGTVNASAYGIKIDGVLNVLNRYGAGCYTLDETTGLYTYTLSKGSMGIYDKENDVYKYVSRHSASGTYDIDVKLVGGNYSINPNVVSEDIVCYVDSNYTNAPMQVVILGEFVESDISIQNKTISFVNKPNAVSYDYEISFISMGKVMDVDKISGNLVASNTTASTLELNSIPEEATAIRVKVVVKGDASKNIFSSVKEFVVDLIISNVDLTEGN